MYYDYTYPKRKHTGGSGSGGFEFLGLLQVALIVLKLLDKIDWSWWLVWSPTWAPILFVVTVAIIAFLWALWE